MDTLLKPTNVLLCAVEPAFWAFEWIRSLAHD
jgi:hypothetical protein